MKSRVRAGVSFTPDEWRAAISKLEGRLILKDASQAHVDQAALGIYALVKNAAPGMFDPKIIKSILDSFDGAQRNFHLDVFLQVVAVQVMNVIESHIAIPGTEKGFVYPAFQKGLPFFPDYGYQVTIQLAKRQVSGKCAKDLLALVQDVDGKNIMIF